MAKLRIKLMFNGEPTGRELSAEASSPEGLWNVITRKLPRDAGWGYRIHVSTAGALEMGAYESNGDVDGTMTVLVPGHEYVTVYIDSDLTDAARALGAKGGAAGRGAAKRRDVDYSALGKRGGRPGPSLAAQAAVVWTELAVRTPAKMSLGPRLTEYMLDGESHLGLTPASAARLIRERAGKRTSAWITRDARVAGEP